MRAAIRRRYGTERGLVRLWLAQLEALCGRLRPFTDIDFSRVRRFVFVCQGNICRSPFAEYAARRAGLPCASFGLSTTTGVTAFAGALAAARACGIDMDAHRATDLADFELRDGDLLLVMEVRQARRLAALTAGRAVQVGLLGAWARPRRVHIHDPFTLSEAYFAHCFAVIESAVAGLARACGAGAPQGEGR